MFIGEPPPTQGDLHFRVLGVPVRVHPLFWIVTLLMGLGGAPDPIEMVIWVGVVFISILVHEMGHAALQIAFGGHPWITLYGFGGLASCNDCDRSPWRQILISLAGPFAGFFFAAFVTAYLHARGHLLGFELSWNPVHWLPFDLNYAMQHNRYAPQDRIIFDLLYVNIFWGLINLLPVYPLDGGRVTRELFTLVSSRGGIISSLMLSIAVASLLAVYAIMHQVMYTGLLFGALAVGNIQTLQMYQRR